MNKMCFNKNEKFNRQTIHFTFGPILKIDY